MSVRTTSLILGLALAMLAGCSDDSSTPADSGPTGDAPPATDGTTPKQDTNTPAGDMTVPTSSALQGIVDKVIIPQSATDYEADVDGNGSKENALGAIAGALKAAQFDMQSDMDWALNKGMVILLMEIFGNSLTDESNAVLQLFTGKDSDSDATDNFSGSEELTIDPSSPSDIKLNCSISGGKLTGGPGNFQILFPVGTKALTVGVKKATLTADVSSSGMANGVINGAVPWTDVDTKILPEIATMMDENYKDPKTAQSFKDLLKLMFDADQDGSLTVDEVRNSAVLKLVLKADVDMDGDGTKDAMSVGVGFTATTCTIKKN